MYQFLCVDANMPPPYLEIHWRNRFEEHSSLPLMTSIGQPNLEEEIKLFDSYLISKINISLRCPLDHILWPHTIRTTAF